MAPGPLGPLEDDEREAWYALCNAPGFRGRAARSVSTQLRGLYDTLAELVSLAPTCTDEPANWTPVTCCALCTADVTRLGMARGFHHRGCLYVRAVQLVGLDDPPPVIEPAPLPTRREDPPDAH